MDSGDPSLAESSKVPIYVITLLQRADRQAHVATLQRSSALPVQVFPAITPHSHAEVPSYDRAWRARHFGYDLTLGEIGCLLSHRALWELCVRSDRILCILEDDVELGDNFSACLRAALAWTGEWDVLRFLAERWDRWRVPVWRLDAEHVLAQYPRPAMGTAAYLLQPHAAQRLLALTEQIRIPVDQVIDRFWAHHLRVRVVEPHPVRIAHYCPSVIAERGWAASHGSLPRPLWRRLQRDLRNGLERALGLIYSLDCARQAWRCRYPASIFLRRLPKGRLRSPADR